MLNSRSALRASVAAPRPKVTALAQQPRRHVCRSQMLDLISAVGDVDAPIGAVIGG